MPTSWCALPCPRLPATRPPLPALLLSLNRNAGTNVPSGAIGIAIDNSGSGTISPFITYKDTTVQGAVQVYASGWDKQSASWVHYGAATEPRASFARCAASLRRLGVQLFKLLLGLLRAAEGCCEGCWCAWQGIAGGCTLSALRCQSGVPAGLACLKACRACPPVLPPAHVSGPPMLSPTAAPSCSRPLPNPLPQAASSTPQSALLPF